MRRSYTAGGHAPALGRSGRALARCYDGRRDGHRRDRRHLSRPRPRRRASSARQPCGLAAAVPRNRESGRSPCLRQQLVDARTRGVGIVLVGAALRDWAILSLGRYFRREVTIEPGQRIVRRGPYRVLRHPSYTGIFLIFAGFGLAFGSWVSAAVALLIVFAGMRPRIWVEERALSQAFGADYEDYANSTARVLPYIW
ncbi:MAG: isoprenylcysteine carboxylmethyltransferase family protein [Actinobacteria bacterium]|nr:MAG: isoprenylcysteine carboxylmethyltransferase family protein [Actinomycetota bacterium]